MTSRCVWPVGAASVIMLVAVPMGWALSRPPADLGSLPPRPPVTPDSALAGPNGAFVPAIGVHGARLEEAPAHQAGPLPVLLRIPALGVRAAIMPVGVDRAIGVVVPPDVRVLGWYRFGAVPGEPGSAVIVGHVDSAEQGAGALFRLAEIAPGARIQVVFGDRMSTWFRVVARRMYPKGQLPARTFTTYGPAELSIITCGGAFNSETRHYAENVIVTAAPLPTGSGDRYHSSSR